MEQGGDCPGPGHWVLRVTHPQMHPWTGAESRSLDTVLLWEIKYVLQKRDFLRKVAFKYKYVSFCIISQTIFHFDTYPPFQMLVQ